MKRFWISMVVVLSAMVFMMYQDGAFAAKPEAGKAKVQEQSREGGTGITAQVDKTALTNGGTITVTGTAPAGKPIYIEVWAEKKIRASRFDADVDKETGKRPYILYMTDEMPAYYKLFMPTGLKETLAANKKRVRNGAFPSF